MPTQIYSTASVAPRERFEFWREALCLNFYGMTAEWEPASRTEDFDATLSATPVMDLSLVELKASAHMCLRREREIAERPGNAMYLYLQTRGAAWFDTPDDRQPFVTPTHAMAIGFSERPMKTTPTNGERFDFQLVRIPLHRIAPLMGQRMVIRARTLENRTSMANLLRGYFDLLFREGPSMDAVAAEAAAQTFARLTAVAYGLAAAENEWVRDAVREAKRQRVLAFVERHLDEPDLSPVRVSQTLGMSVRQLHALFEPTGTSFTQQVRARRLERARMLALSCRGMKIADIAYACGFESVGTFHRGFRQAYGVTPGEWRESLSEGAPAAVEPRQNTPAPRPSR